ncbi:MAG TPA: carbamoyl phosphate synthase large subunit, partial [Candidatus Omnitrophica bacterium]|nr:carbamoyl phosphate synthase large subunit [Candidatus Omnitrophota bacterium]
EAAGCKLPTEGKVLLTVKDKDKKQLLPIAKRLTKLGFIIYATEGTAGFLQKNGIETTVVKKLHEGRPNVVDFIKNKEVNLVINTPAGRESKYDDSCIRIMVIQNKIPYITTIAAALASVEGIEAARGKDIEVKALQDYYKDR